MGQRLERLAFGLMRDVKAVGDGVNKTGIHVGPGYRVYFTRRPERIILLLRSGDKSSQRRDIARAIQMARTMED